MHRLFDNVGVMMTCAAADERIKLDGSEPVLISIERFPFCIIATFEGGYTMEVKVEFHRTAPGQKS